MNVFSGSSIKAAATGLILLAAVHSLHAQEEFVHEPTGLAFTLPADWTYTQEGDHFEAHSPNDDMILLFLAGKERMVEGAMDLVSDMLADFIEDARITADVEMERINGLEQAYLEGDGLVEGVSMDWDLTMVYGRGGTLMVVAMGSIEARQAEVDRIYGSIRQ